MPHEKETLPAVGSRGSESVSNRERSIAQKRTDRFGFWCGLMMVAMVAYIAFVEAGVIA